LTELVMNMTSRTKVQGVFFSENCVYMRNYPQIVNNLPKII